MYKRILMVLLILPLSLCLFTTPIRAEIATEEEMELVCRNWLSYMVYQKGAWAGETRPQIADIDEIVEEDTVLARCFSIAPSGFVVVPVLKELPPVKAYSERYRLPMGQRAGFPQLLREVLLRRIRLYAKIYGSLDAVQPPTGDVLLGRGHKAEWNRFLRSEQEFKTLLRGRKIQALAEVGPLLTTSWHQRAPYNNFCPMGDGGRCVVGCVATAAAQIMKYWNWPDSGTGSHSYTWDGDQSCGGDVGGGTLSATFSDTYDWQNMPDSCDSGCASQDSAALAELCYEVGVAFEMDYGACGSGTWTAMALTVFPTYFKYDSSSICIEDRDETTAAGWFSIIQTEINNGRPIQYRISMHSIVCDGWRDTGGQNQYHMNYGWGGPFTTWFTIDSLYCYWEPDSLCPPMDEYMIRNIMPEGYTLVELSSFTAIGYEDHVEIEWTTATEIDNAGFNLYRSLSKVGEKSKLNEGLIPAQSDELQGASYSFTDENYTPGVTYYYWLEDVDLHGRSTMHGPVSAVPTSVEDREEAPLPTIFSLTQNYPNPFNPVTEIKYGLPKDCAVKLTIYNTLGQKVASLVDGHQKAGYKTATWDAGSLSSGIYFYRLQAGDFVQTKKMVLLK